MANKNILTYGAKLSNVEQDYYAPVATISTSNKFLGTTYCFLSRVLPWGDEENPEQPRQDQSYIKSVFKNIFVAKRINSNDICPVIQRQDWISGIIYDHYRDNVDMFQQDDNGYNVYNFYVKNRYDQVFKCLWNNNGASSTYEPFIQPGAYDTNNIYKGGDGYKWKYMYTIDMGSKVKFMDSAWMPVLIGKHTPNPIQTSAGCGDIEVINVTNGGSGYDPVNSVISVVITGDAPVSANATVDVTSGVITDIIMSGFGSNYTYANVSIVSSNTQLGSNATAIAPVSPIGGHGFDPISELGCSRVMYSVEFNGSENDYIPTDIDYRQVGLVLNPMAQSTYPNFANAAIYKTTTDLVVASGFGAYTPDEVIYQGSNVETATFTATVLSFDSASNIIKLINIKGSPTLNAPVFGNSSTTVRTLLSYSTPDFITHSGYITYIENRTSVQRSTDGIEQFKFVLAY